MTAQNPTRSSPVSPLSLLPLLVAGTMLAGCAGMSPRPSPAAEAAIQDLETVRPGLATKEDSLVLDLLVGYQTLAAGGSDQVALRRAHAAQTQLEHMLRGGGVKEHGMEGRVVTLPDGTRLTLAEAVEQISRAQLYNTPGTAWRPASERAREVQRHRDRLAFLVEDAEWVLTLSAALESDLAGNEKRRLRQLHESYAAGSPHAEVASQVNGLLEDVTDERLRRELKKLANRSWERERRAGDSASASRLDPKRVTPAPEAQQPTGSAASPVVTTPAIPEFLAPPEVPVPSDSTDSLAVPDVPLVTPPERYCEDRRSAAARAFASARAATADEEKKRFLRQSLELIDDCLQRYPETEAAQKAQRNREMIQRELEAR